MMLHDIAAQNRSGTEDQTICQVAAPFIYNSTLSSLRPLRVTMYRPQVLMTNALLNFVGSVSRVQVEMFVERGLRLDAILVEELIQMSELLSYTSLHTGSGTWYNLVLMNNDPVSSTLKQGVHRQYAAYQLAPQCYKWIRIRSGSLSSGVCGNSFEVQRTRYYALHNVHRTGRTFCVR